MMNRYTAGLAALAVSALGCSYNAYTAGDISKRAAGNYSVTCTPVADLITDDGFACRDEKGANVYVVPDKALLNTLNPFKGNPYKAALPQLASHAGDNQTIEVTGTFNLKDNKLEAILLDFGEEGKIFLNQ